MKEETRYTFIILAIRICTYSAIVASILCMIDATISEIQRKIHENKGLVIRS